MREDIIRLLDADRKKAAAVLVERKFTPREFKALQALKESKQFRNLGDGELDRHSIRYFLDKLTSLTIGEADSLSRRVEKMIEAGKLDFQMKTLTEAMADDLASDHEGEEHGMYGLDKGPKTPSGDADKGTDQKDDRGDAASSKGYLDEDEGGPPPEVQAKIDAKKKTETDDEEKPDVKEDHYPGDGDEGGAAKQPADKAVAEDEGSNYDKSSPPIDAGVSEDGDGAEDEDPMDMDDMSAKLESIKKTIARIKESRKNKKLSEADARKKLKEVRRSLKALSEEEVPKDAKSVDDKQTAAKDATHKDGTMQNEADQGQGHEPKAKDPGEPSGGKGNGKPEPEKLGDVEDTPDYSAKAVKAEDPSKSELNKGPAKVSAFEAIESKIVSMLEKAGFAPGTKEWENLYNKGFNRAISERAKFLSKKLQEVRISRKSKK